MFTDQKKCQLLCPQMTENTSVGFAIITWSRKFSDRGGIKSFFYQTFPVQVCAHILLPLGTQFYFKMCALDVLRDDSSILEVTYGAAFSVCQQLPSQALSTHQLNTAHNRLQGRRLPKCTLKEGLMDNRDEHRCPQPCYRESLSLV